MILWMLCDGLCPLKRMKKVKGKVTNFELLVAKKI